MLFVSSILLVLFHFCNSTFGATEVVHEQAKDQHKREKCAKNGKNEVPEQDPGMTFRQKKLLTVLVSPVKILVVLSQVMVVACLRFDNLS